MCPRRKKTAKVSEEGVRIPKELLKGNTEVEIRKHNDLLVVIPTGMADPILRIGENPVVCGVPDASENLDKYLYDNPSRLQISEQLKAVKEPD